jgi:hypothetical protein
MMSHGKRIANPAIKIERMNGTYSINMDTMSQEEAESQFNKIQTAKYEETSASQKVRATFAGMARRITGYLSGKRGAGLTVTEISSEKMDDWFMQSNCNCYSTWQKHIIDQGTLMIRPKHEDEQEEVTRFTSELAACLIVMARNNPEDYSNPYMYIGKWLNQALIQG